MHNRSSITTTERGRVRRSRSVHSIAALVLVAASCFTAVAALGARDASAVPYPDLAVTGNLISNGSFETGLDGWTIGSNDEAGATGTCGYNAATAPGVETITSTPGFVATDGTKIALGSVVSTGIVDARLSCVMYQDVVIPPGITNLAMTYDVGMTAGNDGCIFAGLFVGFFPTDRVPLIWTGSDLAQAPDPICDNTPSTELTTRYSLRASNLDQIAGHTVRVAFVNAAIFAGQEVIGIDNVHLTATYLPSSFHGFSPTRLLDTREAPGAPFAATSTHELVVTGASVPTDAEAVTLSVAVDHPASPGFITVYPCGNSLPPTSSLNFAAGQTIANSVTSGVGTDGKVCIYSSAATDVIVDVNGAYGAGFGDALVGSFAPSRILDTREAPATVKQAGSVTEIDVAGVTGVPADASAVVLNIAVDNPRTDGFVTVYPCGIATPLAANLDFVAGQTVSTTVNAARGESGKVCIYTNATTDLVVDIDGAYAPQIVVPAGRAAATLAEPATGLLSALDGASAEPSHFGPQTLPMRGGFLVDNFVPARLLDTRDVGGTAVAARSVTEIVVGGVHQVPVDASAVTLGVAVDRPTADGFLTVYPCGAPTPWASNLNFSAGQTIANALTTSIGADGKVCVYSSVATHIVVDVTAAFTGAPVFSCTAGPTATTTAATTVRSAMRTAC